MEAIKLTRKQKIAQGLPKPPKKSKAKAEAKKAVRKETVQASLNNCPTSTRKMRLVADQIRGQNVSHSMAILSLSTRASAKRLYKLLLSAISNYKSKKEGEIDFTSVYVKSIIVDGGVMLKRLRPAPQSRGYRVRKRSNHVTIVLDTIQAPATNS